VLPIGDDNRFRLSTPYFTVGLLVLNILMFVFFQGLGTKDEVVYAYSAVPAELLSGQDISTESHIVMDRSSGTRYRIPGLLPTPIPVYLTIIVAMFMHGGFAHLAGNMLYLYIFGDNVEDSLGHLRFLGFYLVSGIVATVAHVLVCALSGDGLYSPSLGASGAISGVLGAYIRLFPGNRVRVLIFNFIPTTVSALFAIGFWFIFQLISGLDYLGGMRGDGVAYAAHIGGFAFGFLTIRGWVPKRRRFRARPNHG